MSIEKLLIQVSNTISPDKNNEKTKYIYLINSYDSIVSTIASANSADRNRFQKLLDEVIKEYIEGELHENFKFIEFVIKTESQLEENQSKKPEVNEIEQLAKEFDKNWKNGLTCIHSNITRNFSNLKIGKEIMKEVVTKMLIYYNMFSKIVTMLYPQKSNLLNDQRIMVELKKLTKEFEFF